MVGYQSELEATNMAGTYCERDEDTEGLPNGGIGST